MNKKKIVSLLAIVLCLSFIVTGCGKSATLKTSKSTVVKTTKGTITAQNYYDSLKESNISVLIDMIDKDLFEKKYPSDDKEEKEINSQIEQIKSYYSDDESSYLTAIKSYFGVNSEDELKEKLSLEYKRGLAVDDYIQDTLTNKEIQDYYDNNIYGDIKASHILIKVETTDSMSDDEKTKADEKALAKAKKVIKKLDDGKDFAEMAKKYSEDTDTADNGGELGYFNTDDMDEDFVKAANALEKGKYSTEPVKTSYGYHIILKEEQKDKAKLKKVKSDIKETLAKEKLNEDSSIYYQSLVEIREKNKITFNDSKIKKAYEDYMADLIKNAKSSSSSSSSSDSTSSSSNSTSSSSSNSTALTN